MQNSYRIINVIPVAIVHSRGYISNKGGVKMAKGKGGQGLLPDDPESRVVKQLPATVHVLEMDREFHLNIWWGKEQALGRRMYELSRWFPYPKVVAKGSG